MQKNRITQLAGDVHLIDHLRVLAWWLWYPELDEQGESVDMRKEWLGETFVKDLWHEGF